MKKLVCLPYEKYESLLSRASPPTSIQREEEKTEDAPKRGPPASAGAGADAEAPCAWAETRSSSRGTRPVSGAGPVERSPPPPPGLPVKGKKRKLGGWTDRWTSI